MSTSNYILQQLTYEHEAEISAFLENLPSGGKLGLNLYRRPSFFEALAVEGSHAEVWAVRESAQNTLVGLVIFHTRQVLIDHQPYTMGIVGGLRVLPQHRGGRTMRIFLKLLKDWLQNSGIHFAISSVFKDNADGNALFEHSGSYLPIRRKLGEFRTAFYNPKYLSQYKLPQRHDFVLHSGSQFKTPEILDIFYELNKQTNMLPVYTANHLQQGTELLKNLKPEHVLLAEKDGKIVAMTGLWNQTNFRNWQIQSYPPILRISRPALNLLANFKNMPTLPAAQKPIQYAQLAITAYSDSSAFISLMKEAGKLASQNNWHSIAHGTFMHSTDISIFPPIHYSFLNNIYFLGIKDDEIFKNLQNIYLELGSL